MIEKILSVIDNKELLLEMGKKGKELVMEKFQRKNLAIKYLNHIKMVINK